MLVSLLVVCSLLPYSVNAIGEWCNDPGCIIAATILAPGTMNAIGTTNHTFCALNVTAAYWYQPNNTGQICIGPVSTLTAYPGSRVVFDDDGNMFLGRYDIVNIYGVVRLGTTHIFLYEFVKFECHGELSMSNDGGSLLYLYDFAFFFIDSPGLWFQDTATFSVMYNISNVTVEGTYHGGEGASLLVGSQSALHIGSGSLLDLDKYTVINMGNQSNLTIGYSSSLRLLDIYGYPSLHIGNRAALLVDPLTYCVIIAPFVVADNTTVELTKHSSIESTILCGSTSGMTGRQSPDRKRAENVRGNIIR